MDSRGWILTSVFPWLFTNTTVGQNYNLAVKYWRLKVRSHQLREHRTAEFKMEEAEHHPLVFTLLCRRESTPQNRNKQGALIIQHMTISELVSLKKSPSSITLDWMKLQSWEKNPRGSRRPSTEKTERGSVNCVDWLCSQLHMITMSNSSKRMSNCNKSNDDGK